MDYDRCRTIVCYMDRNFYIAGARYIEIRREGRPADCDVVVTLVTYIRGRLKQCGRDISTLLRALGQLLPPLRHFLARQA